MIEAVLKGKLGTGQSRARERSEDLLTSTAFGLLRYLPHEHGIIALLRQTRRAYLDNEEELHVESDKTANNEWLGMEAAATCDFEFWPGMGKYGQPDLLLRVRDTSNNLIHLAVVEVKFDAGKSGVACEDACPIAGDEPDADQLVKYGQGIATIEPEAADVQRTVVYMTSDVIPPSEELLATLQRKRNMRIGWVSWRELLRIAERYCVLSPGDLPARDLVRLLEYHGFKDFDGMRSEPFTVPLNSHFWRSLFSDLPSFTAIHHEGFWRPR